MFYFGSEGWEAYAKKINFKEPKEVYDNNAETYRENPAYIEVTEEDIILTEEQNQRLHMIKKFQNLDYNDVRKYVMDGDTALLSNPEVYETVGRIEKERKLFSIIDWDTITREEMLYVADVFDLFDENRYYEAGDVFNYQGELYIVVTSHVPDDGADPSQNSDLYTPVAPSV